MQRSGERAGANPPSHGDLATPVASPGVPPPVPALVPRSRHAGPERRGPAVSEGAPGCRSRARGRSSRGARRCRPTYLARSRGSPASTLGIGEATRIPSGGPAPIPSSRLTMSLRSVGSLALFLLVALVSPVPPGANVSLAWVWAYSEMRRVWQEALWAMCGAGAVAGAGDPHAPAQTHPEGVLRSRRSRHAAAPRSGSIRVPVRPCGPARAGRAAPHRRAGCPPRWPTMSRHRRGSTVPHGSEPDHAGGAWPSDPAILCDQHVDPGYHAGATARATTPISVVRQVARRPSESGDQTARR